MLRISFVILALASILTLNGCTQCGNNQVETAPQEVAPPEQTNDVPAPPAEASAEGEGEGAAVEMPAPETTEGSDQ
jgi:PBP1b-binding outer membrane lipoprotein LpoB